MEQKKPLMPKAIAAWLIKNTSLNFDQIANFCKLHPIEIQHLADEENIVGIDPISQTRQLSKEEIQACEKDPLRQLTLQSLSSDDNALKKQRQYRYVPITHRKNKPSAILWLIKHPVQVSDQNIKKLVGTTVDTITKIRNKTYKGYLSLTPKDPVTLNLCSQEALNSVIENSEKQAQKTKT